MSTEYTYAFISKYPPTPSQIEMASRYGITLDYVGDRNAFHFSPTEYSKFDGVIVSHPAMALRLLDCKRTIGVFENVLGPEDPGTPNHKVWVAKRLHIYKATGTPYIQWEENGTVYQNGRTGPKPQSGENTFPMEVTDFHLK